MVKISERRNRLLLTADKLQKERFEKRIRMLEEEYRKEENRQAVIQVFIRLFSLWKSVHENSDGTEKASSLGIGYLLGSILTKSYELKLSLLGEAFWLEEEPVEIMWKPPYFFEYFEEDMTLIIKELRSGFPRLCRAEEDAARLKCVDYYLAAVCTLCRDMAEEMIESNEFTEIDKTDNFFFFFGKFQGEGEKIWSISN